MSQSVSAVPVAPGGVDSVELARLFLDPAANDQAIKLELWKLAARVAKDVNGREDEQPDAHANVYAGMLKALPKYNPHRGSPVDYFWTVGQRAGWYQARKDMKRPQAVELSTTEPKACGVRNMAALTHGLRPPKNKSPLKLLDIRLRRCQKALRKLGESDEAERRHLTTGIAFLQLHRYDLAGAYLVMELPGVRYTPAKIVTIAT